jgi:hypothetical protein
MEARLIQKKPMRGLVHSDAPHLSRPSFWADGIGVRDVYNQIAAWHQQYGERWAPSKLLRDLAEAGTPFKEAKAAPFV